MLTLVLREGSKGAKVLKDFIEETVGHKLMWVICFLHSKEFFLRNLFLNLDGKTTGKHCFLSV